MTEEYASFKQIEFMKKLGFGPQSADLTKADARQMIDGKLKEQESAPTQVMASPEEQAVRKAWAPKTNGKEFHLTPEAVKLGCLNAAIEILGKLDVEKAEQTTSLADKFVEWVYK